MKIQVLIENLSCREDLACEHGLSLYIETGKHRILFDAGQSGAFADNAEKLGVDLRSVDFAVLSHGHYDHGGGLSRFLEINKAAKIYINKEALFPHFNRNQKNIGVNDALPESSRLVFVGDVFRLEDGITLYSCNDRQRPYPTDQCGMSVLQNGQLQPDDFRHEQYLMIEENGRRVCISGCSHKGILNITDWFQPDVLIGGFHFVDLALKGEDVKILQNAAEKLTQYSTIFYAGHCTGTSQFLFLKQIMGEQLHKFSTGSIIEI